MRKIIIIGLFTFHFIFIHVSAQTNPQIEIFDISKNEVIKRVDTNSNLYQDASRFLEGITGIYVGISPIPKEGYMIKIPLDPEILVKNQWLNKLLDEVIIIFPTQENPYLMVFDNNRPLFFNFEGDTQSFLEKLNFSF
ncbi:hypothetical protein [Chengkuizengella axinellae]|uniref:Group-specific protein n=1 Tax=Chengkuizengella axinellae TaxID=3064388 RepID=A0ABT9IWZ5_9BACL|nr:hypothetical protein [Chengkuizengella sp. 2205SS18-9]MDP5273860.1 hypothetical protein [Chengkuizengella sp. 2205SS18-9]